MNNIYLQQIGERIQHEREEKKLSQSAIAEKISVSRQTFSRWEKGKGDGPTVRDLKNLCEIFDCDLGYLSMDYSCKRHKNVDIVEQTFISEKAAENLKKNAGGYWKALSSILESDTFWQFLKLMETYKLVGTTGDSVGEYVNERIESAAKDLLPNPKPEDLGIFNDGFFQAICARYCWLLMEEYKNWDDSTVK